MDEFQKLVQGGQVGLADLACEYCTNHMGIDIPQPRLSWKMMTSRRGARQAAYQIIVAGSPEELASGSDILWDSGIVQSDQSVHVRYAGEPLPSRQRAWWSVRIWDEQGQVFQSEPAWWEMGLLGAADWKAQWIGAPYSGGPATTAPVPYLRKTFVLDKPVDKARLYVTSLGLYECSLNGERVGDEVFAPGWTDYHKRVQYQVHDVSGLLHQGENVLGSILGDGWYCGNVAWMGRQVYGDRPKLLAQLEITHPDGSRTTLVTDESWNVSRGPILESDFLMGESYDAREELDGWDQPGFDESGWQPAMIFPDPGAMLVSRRGPAVRRIEELRPIAEAARLGPEDSPKWVFDFGQNMVGWVRLRLQGEKGATVKLRFAEVINQDGTLYTTNLRTARSTDVYTCKGQEEEVFEPHFTFHGFRHVEINGLREPPDREAVTGVVVHSDMPVTGSFECSDPLLNQLQHNIQWGQKGNFVDVPTDCPQRDERLGWTGDAQVFIRTAAFNMNVGGFFTKWVQDLEDAQSGLGQIPSVAPNVIRDHHKNDGGPAWADAFVICPWTIYQVFGDREILEAHYPNIKRFVDHLADASLEGIRCHPEGIFRDGDWSGYGDWLSINAETPKDLIGTAFLAHDARLVARMAGVLGLEEDRLHYQALADTVRAAFMRRFVTADGLLASQSQTAYVLALHFDLLPEELRPAAARALVRDIRLRKDHLSTGFVGAPYLMHALTSAGRNDVAYTLLNQKTWPSWLYPVTKGATTIWERWDGWTHDRGFQDAGMNSFNHYAYGSIGDWLYSTVAGIDIDPDQPGYKHILMRLQPGGGLTCAQASYESMFGKIFSRWQLDEGVFTWDVTIPPNTTATLFFPAHKNNLIREGAKPIDDAEGLSRMADGSYQAVAGSYSFRMQIEEE